jgi:putative membrane protein insertion efficiency factor
MNPGRGIAARALLLCVHAYRLLLSPILGGACRFQPSCSQYSLDAIALHGARRGAWLSIKRIARCHPFRAGGYDPVPANLVHRP